MSPAGIGGARVGGRPSVVAWVAAVIALAPALGPAGALAQRDQPQVSRFQDPAEERSIEAAEDDAADEEEELEEAPEQIEERLYLRERPDAVGAAAREYQNERLAALLAEREQWVVERRDQAIQLLENFIRAEPETAAEMPDALMRLAELRWEQARVDYLRAFAAWQEVPERNRGPAPSPDYRRSMQLYDRILTQHPRYERVDLVLYMKAYAHVEKGESDQALALYQKILEEHPRSRFVPDAHFALAEARFSVSEWPGALAEFEKVMEHRESELYDISLFKSAWALWRMGRTQEAALRFRQVLDLGRGRGPMSAAQRRRLRELQDEALDYLIQVFIEDENNTAADVFAFLEEIGGERYAHKVLVRLSDTFMGQSRYDRAIEAYQLLLEMDPMDRKAPQYQREIATAQSHLGEPAATIEAMAVAASDYGVESAWAVQQADPERVERERKRTERMIRRQAMRWHEIGQRENQRVLLENAVKLYEVYLEHFGDLEPAYEISFYRGEILFHRLERFPEAGDAYLLAAEKEPEGRFTKDALYNAIGAFERVREVEVAACADGSTPAAPAATPAAAPDAEAESESGMTDEAEASAPPAANACEGETANDRKFAQAIELYVQLFPDDPDLPEILFRQGRLYYDRGIYDPAVRLFGQLLERFPESRFAAPAGELILDSFNRAQDYANIESWARRLKAAPAFDDAESQRRLDSLILMSMFKVGEQLAERGAHGEAAAAYLRAAEEFPSDERAPEALFNAGVEHQAAGELEGADAAYSQLIERHPNSEVGAQGAWAGAQMYESIAQFRDAARFYRAYAQQFPRGEKAADAHYNAVLLLVTAGEYDQAVEVGRDYVQKYPRRDETDDVYFFIGRAQEEAEDFGEAADTYRGYVRRSRNDDRKVEAQTRLAQVLMRAGDAPGADRALASAVRTASRSRRLTDGRYYAAQARYMQGERVLAEYEAIEIAGDPDGLRGRLQRKSELLQRAALVYADVASMGVAEWVSASLYQIGRSYELFAEAMRAFELPEGLSEDEEQVYLDQLAMFIIPMEERALEAYEGGYQKAIELRIFNDWTAKLREALTRLNDIQYPPLRETGGDLVQAPPLPIPQPLDGLRRGAPEAAAEEEGE